MFLAPGMVSGCLMTTWGGCPWMTGRMNSFQRQNQPFHNQQCCRPNKRHRPSMPTIPEEPGRSSSSASGLPGGGSGASGLPAEGRNANNMEQCLQMLGSYLERKKRFDNRGYRSQIRRQLRRLLDDNDIHYPDWLDDHTQPVNEWKHRAFKEIQSIKKTGKLTTQTGPSTGQTGPVPVSPAPVSGGAVACLQKAQACLQSGGYKASFLQPGHNCKPPLKLPGKKKRKRNNPPHQAVTWRWKQLIPGKLYLNRPGLPGPMVEEQSLQAGGNQDAGANGLPEEGIAGVNLKRLQGCLLLPACLQKAVQESNLNRLQRCLLVPMACLKKALQEAV